MQTSGFSGSLLSSILSHVCRSEFELFLLKLPYVIFRNFTEYCEQQEIKDL